MPPVVVPVFALAVWLASYLIGRDPRRRLHWRAAAALIAYAAGVAAWTIDPGGGPAAVLLCVPALMWAGVAIGLLPEEMPERTPLDRGWLMISAAFLAAVVLVPGAARLVAVAPLAGGLVLLWRFHERVRPAVLPAAVTVVASLYAFALVALLLPIDLGAPPLVLAAAGLDLAVLGYLVAVADATDAGERLWPDLRRSAVGAAAGALLVGGLATLTILAVPGRPLLTGLQFGVVGVVMAYAGLIGPVRRGLDRVAFPHDDRLRQDRQALALLSEALPRRRERHTLLAVSEEEFRRLTVQALDNFGDLARLLRSPLIDLPTVDRRLAGENAERPMVRALQLRAVLQESIARLKPDGLFGTTEEWRHYNALHFCCVVGLRPYDRRPVTDGLDRDSRRALEWFRRYVPRRSLRQWQREAAALVADRLWGELMRTDPRWLTRAGTMAAPPTRSS